MSEKIHISLVSLCHHSFLYGELLRTLLSFGWKQTKKWSISAGLSLFSLSRLEHPQAINYDCADIVSRYTFLPFVCLPFCLFTESIRRTLRPLDELFSFYPIVIPSYRMYMQYLHQCCERAPSSLRLFQLRSQTGKMRMRNPYAIYERMQLPLASRLIQDGS